MFYSSYKHSEMNLNLSFEKIRSISNPCKLYWIHEKLEYSNNKYSQFTELNNKKSSKQLIGNHFLKPEEDLLNKDKIKEICITSKVKKMSII